MLSNNLKMLGISKGICETLNNSSAPIVGLAESTGNIPKSLLGTRSLDSALGILEFENGREVKKRPIIWQHMVCTP